MFVYHIYLVFLEARREPQIPGTGVLAGCEPLGGCLEMNPGPLEGQPMSSTMEPFLQPPIQIAKCFKNVVVMSSYS